MSNRRGYVWINGALLRDARTKKRISRDRLAEICGYSCASTILEWEKGQRRVDENVIPVIAKALDISAEDLMRKDYTGPPIKTSGRPGYTYINGKRLRAAREKAGYSRKVFATMCGYSYQSLAAIEAERRKLDESAIPMITDLLDISKEELVKGDKQ